MKGNIIITEKDITSKDITSKDITGKYITGKHFIVATMDDVINWMRKSSIWYLLFGTACCAIELMQTGGPRTDLDRIGSVFRSTPRQADLMIVAGTITYKMAERVVLLYHQMAEPKYVLSMGSCANCGGLFQNSYSVLKGVDRVIPVDVYVPGCPPRPEALMEGVLKIQQIMMKENYIKNHGRRNT